MGNAFKKATPKTRIHKMVAIGDGEVGKTSILMTKKLGNFPDDPHIPTVFHAFMDNVEIDGVQKSIKVQDTAGQDGFEELLKEALRNATCVFIIFATNKPESLDNIDQKWYARLQEYQPDAAKILICNKTDLRTDRNTIEEMQLRGETLTTEQQGRQTADRIGAEYFEVSAKTSEVSDIENIFKKAYEMGENVIANRLK